MAGSDPLLGYVVGDRYRLTRRIGKGGFGAVFEAEHVTLKRLFAIKVLARQLELDPRFLKRFEHEARLTASLEHPHIVQVTDYGQDERLGSWFAMEYLRGDDLQSRIARDGRLDNATAVKLMRQVVDAFVYAHKQGVIHRDVKSANVFLVSTEAVTDHVKVLDFGIARVLDAAAEPSDERLTKTGTVMGSPAYMAPEQALNLAVDARTDIYALGIVLYEMVTGRVPFTATSALAVLTKQIKEAPAAPSEIVPQAGVNPHLELVILKCLQKKMDRRYQTTSELAEALALAEERIHAGDQAPTELMETLSGLRTDMIADGSLLADSSEIDQRRIVAGKGYTSIQREMLADGDARTNRRVLVLLAALLGVAVLVAGAWWLGARNAGQPIPAGSEVASAPAKPTNAPQATQSPAAPGASAGAAATAVPGGDKVAEAGPGPGAGEHPAAPNIAVGGAGTAPSGGNAMPTEAGKPVPPADGPLHVVVDTDPAGTLVRWKDGRGDSAVAPGTLDIRAADAGRVLVVSKKGFKDREVALDAATIEGFRSRPTLEVKLDPVAARPAQNTGQGGGKKQAEGDDGFLGGFKR